MRHKICFHLPGAQRMVAPEQLWLQAIVAPLWNTFESCKCKRLILAELLKGWCLKTHHLCHRHWTAMNNGRRMPSVLTPDGLRPCVGARMMPAASPDITMEYIFSFLVRPSQRLTKLQAQP